MKKTFLLLTMLLTCAVARADFTAVNKTIEVVIPQSSASGLSQIFLTMQNYAEKQKISLVPVFKPGASGKIGLDYVEKNSNNANTLLLATVSDIAQNKAANRFIPVTNVSEVKLVLVASKKSNIKHINDIVKESPDKFNWAYTSTPQLALINSIADHYNLEKSKMNLVSYNPTKGVPLGVSLISGDVDIGYVMHTQAKKFIETDKLNLVELDASIKKKLEAKPNSVALFLPKNNNSSANKFWQDFVTGFLQDEDTLKKFNTAGVKPLPVGPDHLIQVLNSWDN